MQTHDDQTSEVTEPNVLPPPLEVRKPTTGVIKDQHHSKPNKVDGRQPETVQYIPPTRQRIRKEKSGIDADRIRLPKRSLLQQKRHS
jgi:hypothetical protein